MREKISEVMSNLLNVDKAIIIQSEKDQIPEWDSIQHMNLILALEEEFGVRFSDTQIPKMLSLQHIENEILNLKKSSN